MKLVKTQTVFLNSDHRDSGSTADATYNFPAGMIGCKHTQHLRVSLHGLSLYNTIYNVVSGSNVLEIQTQLDGIENVSIVIPEGNYSMVDLAAFIETSYNTSVVSAQSLTVTYSAVTNTFTFAFANFSLPSRLVFFTEELAALFGFSLTFDLQAGGLATSFGIEFESNVVVLPRSTNELFIRLYGVSTIDGTNLENILSDKLARYGNLLAYIPLDVPSFELLHWRANSSDEYHIFIGDHHVTELRIQLVDKKGVLLNSLEKGYIMVLRIDTLEQD